MKSVPEARKEARWAKEIPGILTIISFGMTMMLMLSKLMEGAEGGQR